MLKHMIFFRMDTFDKCCMCIINHKPFPHTQKAGKEKAKSSFGYSRFCLQDTFVPVETVLDATVCNSLPKRNVIVKSFERLL